MALSFQDSILSGIESEIEVEFHNKIINEGNQICDCIFKALRENCLRTCETVFHLIHAIST